MPNLLLTQRCVRSCPYCFAKKHMVTSNPDDILSWEDLIYLADFLESSGERRISLLGGEPTLHPEFTDFLIYLLERNFSITVFTSGIMSRKVLHIVTSNLSNVLPEKLSFVCNINDPQISSPYEIERIKDFLEIFGIKICPSFNIYKYDFKLDFLFQYINQYGLQRTIRIGIAHPILGMKNQFIKINKIQNVVEQLMSYTPVFDRLRIKPSLDCGFPMCAFTDTQIGWLYKMTGGMFHFSCHPAIDIGPDMSVWPCFPLSGFYKRSVFEFDSLNDIYQFYEEKLHMIRIEAEGIFEECDECKYREEESCSGGCAAHLLSIFKNEAPVRIPEIYL